MTAIVKVTVVSGFIKQVSKEPKTQSIPSQSIKVQRDSRDTWLLAKTYYPSAGYYPVQNQIIVSRWMHINCLCYVDGVMRGIIVL